MCKNVLAESIVRSVSRRDPQKVHQTWGPKNTGVRKDIFVFVLKSINVGKLLCSIVLTYSCFNLTYVVFWLFCVEFVFISVNRSKC